MTDVLEALHVLFSDTKLHFSLILSTNPRLLTFDIQKHAQSSLEVG